MPNLKTPVSRVQKFNIVEGDAAEPNVTAAAAEVTAGKPAKTKKTAAKPKTGTKTGKPAKAPAAKRESVKTFFTKKTMTQVAQGALGVVVVAGLTVAGLALFGKE